MKSITYFFVKLMQVIHSQGQLIKVTFVMYIKQIKEIYLNYPWRFSIPLALIILCIQTLFRRCSKMGAYPVKGHHHSRPSGSVRNINQHDLINNDLDILNEVRAANQSPSPLPLPPAFAFCPFPWHGSMAWGSHLVFGCTQNNDQSPYFRPTGSSWDLKEGNGQWAAASEQ